MTQLWNDLDLRDLWTLATDELALLPGMTDKGRLAFAVQLKFMELYGRFPERHDEVDSGALNCLATQLNTGIEGFTAVDLNGRQGRRHRRSIRVFLGFRPATGADIQRLSDSLVSDVLPFDPQARHGRDIALDWFLAQRLEPPANDQLERAIRSTVHEYETGLQETVYSRLSAVSKAAIDGMLVRDDSDAVDDSTNTADATSTFTQLKTDLGKSSRDNLLLGIERRQAIDAIGLVADVFKGVPLKFIDQFRQRCATESIRELRRHPVPIRYSMVAMFCWRRRQQLTDGLVDMLLQIIHTIGTRAEKKIDKKQFAAFKKVRGKARLLYKVAEATVDQPDGVVKEVVYPVVSQKMLKELVAEFGALSTDVEREVQETMRSCKF